MMLPTHLLRVLALVVGVGIFLGVAWALWEFRPRPGGVVDFDEQDIPQVIEQRPTFGEHFALFFFGRTGDGSRIRRSKPLVRSTKFIAGERVGLRVQTADTVVNAFRVQLRFVTSGTREETSTLRRSRHGFTIRPGILTYCCVKIPNTPGRVDVGILVDEAYVGFLPITIKPAPTPGTGGLFAPAPAP